MTKNVDSMLNENNTKLSKVFLKSQINYHKEFSPFARRPLTTWLIESTSKAFNIELGVAFVRVNFFFLFSSGILLFVFSRKLKASFRHGILNMIVYFGTFSVLFAFFPPVFSYDEPLQYCLILASLIAFFQREWIWYVLFFTLAMISRESSIFLIFGLALFFPGLEISHGKNLSKFHWRKLFIITLPVIFYIVFLTLFLWKSNLWETTLSEITGRFSCLKENFRNWQNSVETITSLLLVLGPFVYFLTVYLKRNAPSVFEKKFIYAFWLTAAVNTIIVILATFAREARLFALPLFFIWPLFGHLFSKEIRILCSPELYRKCFAQWQYVATFLLFGTINYLISFKVYTPSFNPNDNYYNEYLFLMLLMISTHFLLRHFLDRNKGMEEKILQSGN